MQWNCQVLGCDSVLLWWGLCLQGQTTLFHQPRKFPPTYFSIFLHFPTRLVGPQHVHSGTGQHHPPKARCGRGTDDYGLLSSSGFNYRCSQLQRKGKGLGRTCQAQTLPGSQEEKEGGEQGSQTLPSHPTAIGLFWGLGSFNVEMLVAVLIG